MNYINIETKQVVGIQYIRGQYPQTSFTDSPTNEDLAPFGYANLNHTNPPQYDDTEFYLQAVDSECVDGVWSTAWAVMPLDGGEAMSRKVKRFDLALTDHLDSVAQQKNYDNRITCALRAGYHGPFQAEGIAFASWMDQCNAMAYQIFNDVMANRRPMPSSPDEFIGELPKMVWV